MFRACCQSSGFSFLYNKPKGLFSQKESEGRGGEESFVVFSVTVFFTDAMLFLQGIGLFDSSPVQLNITGSTEVAAVTGNLKSALFSHSESVACVTSTNPSHSIYVNLFKE